MPKANFPGRKASEEDLDIVRQRKKETPKSNLEFKLQICV